eukprot:15447117-Alexandrium_andersonii.AAC.1
MPASHAQEQAPSLSRSTSQDSQVRPQTSRNSFLRCRVRCPRAGGAAKCVLTQGHPPQGESTSPFRMVPNA